MIRTLSIFALLLGVSALMTSSAEAQDCYYRGGYGYGYAAPRYVAPVQVYRPPVYRSPSVFIGGPTIIQRTYSVPNVYHRYPPNYYRAGGRSKAGLIRS